MIWGWGGGGNREKKISEALLQEKNFRRASSRKKKFGKAFSRKKNFKRPLRGKENCKKAFCRKKNWRGYCEFFEFSSRPPRSLMVDPLILCLPFSKVKCQLADLLIISIGTNIFFNSIFQCPYFFQWHFIVTRHHDRRKILHVLLPLRDKLVMKRVV